MKRLAGIAMLAIILSACKPTEKNYREAYDLAYQTVQDKREAEQTGVSGDRIESLDAPRIEVVEGDSIYVGKHRVRLIDDEASSPEAYGVAVAKYSMKTNASHHVESLRHDYPQAAVAREGQETFYVIIGFAPSITETAPLTKAFKKKNPHYAYPGLGYPLTLSVITTK